MNTSISRSLIEFKVALLLILILGVTSSFCYAADPIEKLIFERLSADKKTLDLSGLNLGSREAKILADLSFLSKGYRIGINIFDALYIFFIDFLRS